MFALFVLQSYHKPDKLCWSKIHGKPKATYAAQIIGSCIEANFEEINRQMADIAQREGITEFKGSAIASNTYSPYSPSSLP